MKTKRVSKRSATPSRSKAKAGVAMPKGSARARKAAKAARPKTRAAKGADTFTVRDLNRRPQEVLAAADAFGSIHVEARSGKRYLIRSEPSAADMAATREAFRRRLDALHAKMRKNGEGFTAEGWETFSRAIAGE